MEKILEYPELLFGVGVGLAIAIVAGMVIIYWVLSAWCMMIGAKIMNIEHRTFGKALLSALLITFLGGGIVGFLTVIHPLLGLAGVFLVPGFFIQAVYSCGLIQAIGAYIFNIIASVVLMIILIFTLFFTLGISLDKLHKEQQKKDPGKAADTTTALIMTNPSYTRI